MKLNQPIETYFERLLADRSQFAHQLHLNFSLLNIITAGFIFGIFDGHLNPTTLLMWVGGLIAIVLLEMLLYGFYLFKQKALPAWIWEFLYLSGNLLACTMVGSGIWLLKDTPSDQSSLFVSIITLIYAVILYGSHLFNVRVFAVCVSGLLLPTIVFDAQLGTTQGFLFMIAFLVAGLMLIVCSYASSQFFKVVSLSRYEVEELSKKLQIEKETTEIALELANSTNQAKSMFFATANHDLRQPLHALGLLIEALKLEKNLPYRAQSIVEQMTGSASTLNQMFNHFLDINHIETGQLRVNLQTIDLNTVFNDVIVLHRLAAADKGLELRMSPTTVKVHTDAGLLTRILSNLVSNAIAYTEQGSIWLGYRASLQSIEVRDSGIGIAAEYHESIFKDFYQVHRDEFGGQQGYGLGLSIVHRLSNILQIPLTLNSALGKGTVFRLNLLNHNSSQPRVRQHTEPIFLENEVDAALKLKNTRVLLIENDEHTRYAMVQILNDWGVSLRTAMSSEAALDVMRRNDQQMDEWQPDLIISDYHLGQKTWLDLVLAVREAADKQQPEVHLMQKWYCPILFTTTDTSIVKTSLGVRNSLMLFKPIDAKVLLNGILSLLYPQ